MVLPYPYDNLRKISCFFFYSFQTFLPQFVAIPSPQGQILSKAVGSRTQGQQLCKFYRTKEIKFFHETKFNRHRITFVLPQQRHVKTIYCDRIVYLKLKARLIGQLRFYKFISPIFQRHKTSLHQGLEKIKQQNRTEWVQPANKPPSGAGRKRKASRAWPPFFFHRLRSTRFAS